MCWRHYLIPAVLLLLHSEDGVDMVFQELVRQLTHAGVILKRRHRLESHRVFQCCCILLVVFCFCFFKPKTRSFSWLASSVMAVHKVLCLDNSINLLFLGGVDLETFQGPLLFPAPAVAFYQMTQHAFHNSLLHNSCHFPRLSSLSCCLSFPCFFFFFCVCVTERQMATHMVVSCARPCSRDAVLQA